MIRSELTGYDVLKTFIEKFCTAQQETSKFWNKRSKKLRELRDEILKEQGSSNKDLKVVRDLYLDGKITDTKLVASIEEYNKLHYIVLPEDVK